MKLSASLLPAVATTAWAVTIPEPSVSDLTRRDADAEPWCEKVSYSC